MMQFKLFVLPVSNTSPAEAETNAFLRSHRVLGVKTEFVSAGENSFWALCVEYLEGPSGSNGPASAKLPKVDYKEVLKPQEFEVFSRLREWRKTTADQEGVPVYVVFTNEQLAEMVQKRVTSKAALQGIEGVGEARVQKYGEAILERLVFNPVPE